MQTAWHGTQATRTCCVSLVMECSTSRPATSLCTSKNCRYSTVSFVFPCTGTINLSSGLERNSWLNTSCLSSTYRAESECCVNLLLIFRKMIRRKCWEEIFIVLCFARVLWWVSPGPRSSACTCTPCPRWTFLSQLPCTSTWRRRCSGQLCAVFIMGRCVKMMVMETGLSEVMRFLLESAPNQTFSSGMLEKMFLHFGDMYL